MTIPIIAAKCRSKPSPDPNPVPFALAFLPFPMLRRTPASWQTTQEESNG